MKRELGCEGRGGGKVARVDGVFVGVTVEERERVRVGGGAQCLKVKWSGSDTIRYIHCIYMCRAF